MDTRHWSNSNKRWGEKAWVATRLPFLQFCVQFYVVTKYLENTWRVQITVPHDTPAEVYSHYCLDKVRLLRQLQTLTDYVPISKGTCSINCSYIDRLYQKLVSITPTIVNIDRLYQKLVSIAQTIVNIDSLCTYIKS